MKTLLSMLLLVALSLAASPAVRAAEAARLARIASAPPSCMGLSALPIVPNDPAAITAGGSRRCLGTRPPELAVWLPADDPAGGYAWLQRGPDSPAVWLDLGGVVVDPRQFDPLPLGLRLTSDPAGPILEMRLADSATLTPLEEDRWQPVTGPDGEGFWVRIDSTAGAPTIRSDRSSESRATRRWTTDR
jgi:hypothetical protein